MAAENNFPWANNGDGVGDDHDLDLDDIVTVPITDELDLHTFSPKDLGIVLPEYLRECRLRGLRQVRIVHGKGTGALRESVRALLARLPGVLGYRTGNETEGGWGATVVELEVGVRNEE